MRQYDPKDWYWVVGGSATEVYSSKTHTFVPITNADYLTWKADAPFPPTTQVANNAELGSVLAQHDLRPTIAGVLAGYLDAKLDQVVNSPLYRILLDVYVELLHPTPNETQVRTRIRSKF